MARRTDVTISAGGVEAGTRQSLQEIAVMGLLTRPLYRSADLAARAARSTGAATDGAPIWNSGAQLHSPRIGRGLCASETSDRCNKHLTETRWL
jgi:hypothetical protein